MPTFAPMQRVALACVALVLVAGCRAASGTSGGGPGGNAGGRTSEIGIENANAGTGDWVISHAVRRHELEAYALEPSVAPGGTISIAVSASESSSFHWEVFRMGYYGGLRARRLSGGGPVHADPQPRCGMKPSTGLVECRWSATLALKTEPSWVRGVYLVKLTREDGFETYAPFLLQASTPAPVLAVIPTATWQAYNAYGGESLYDDATRTLPHHHADQVSYDRPYVRGNGAGDLLEYDLALISWIESLGVDVDYASSPELDANPALLTHRRVILLSGHDEYWSHVTRTTMDSAVSGGSSLMLLGANAGYWQVRFEPSSDGRPNRVVTCFKEDAATSDPVGPNSPLLTVKFRDPPVSMPESRLFGVMFDGFHQYGFPQVVGSTQHWAFDQTGFQSGDTVWGVAGYEFDSRPTDDPSTPASDLLMDAPTFSFESVVGRSQMVVRDNGSSVVFAAGGIDLVRALAPGPYADPRVSRLVWNVLSRALGQSLPPPPPLTRVAPVQIATFASSVTTLAGVPGQPGDVDGPKGVGQFVFPVAVATLPDGSLVVADAGAAKLKRVARDGTIRTLVGPPLIAPAGLAADAQGVLYVSDAKRQVIFRVALDGTWTELAGHDGTQGAADGVGTEATFSLPQGLAFARSGRLLVADAINGEIRSVDVNTREVGTLARGLYRPSAVTVEPSGRIDVVEAGMSRVVALDRGTLTPLTGTGPGDVDGPALAAHLQPYLGLAAQPDGSLVISDPGSDHLRLLSGGTLRTFAGTGLAGTHEGRGDQTDVVLPGGLAVGSDGTIYLAESGNAVVRAIRP